MGTVYKYRVEFFVYDTIVVSSEYAPREVAEKLNGDFEYFAKNGVIYPKSQIARIELMDEIEMVQEEDEIDYCAIEKIGFR